LHPTEGAIVAFFAILARKAPEMVDKATFWGKIKFVFPVVGKRLVLFLTHRT